MGRIFYTYSGTKNFKEYDFMYFILFYLSFGKRKNQR